MAQMNQLVDHLGAQTLHLRISLVGLHEGHQVQYCPCTVASMKPQKHWTKLPTKQPQHNEIRAHET